MEKKNTVGYLPDERPPIWQLLLYAVQQVIVMFPATVAVALATGFHISTTIFASGLATLGFVLITKRQLPPLLWFKFFLSFSHYRLNVI